MTQIENGMIVGAERYDPQCQDVKMQRCTVCHEMWPQGDLTYALSVACKALGVAADVYWQSDRDKYNTRQEQPQTASRAAVDKLYQLWRKKGYTDDQLPGWSSKNMGNTPDKLTEDQVNRLIKAVEGWPDAT